MFLALFQKIKLSQKFLNVQYFTYHPLWAYIKAYKIPCFPAKFYDNSKISLSLINLINICILLIIKNYVKINILHQTNYSKRCTLYPVVYFFLFIVLDYHSTNSLGYHNCADKDIILLTRRHTTCGRQLRPTTVQQNVIGYYMPSLYINNEAFLKTKPQSNIQTSLQ